MLWMITTLESLAVESCARNSVDGGWINGIIASGLWKAYVSLSAIEPFRSLIEERNNAAYRRAGLV